MIKPHLWAVLIILFVLVQGERRKYKGLYSSMFVVGKINHCPVYRCILFYLAVCAAAAKLLQSCPVWPHKWQPPRLPHPWDSPGKKTGVGCHFLLQCMKVKSEREASQSCLTLSNPMDCNPPGSSIHEIFQARVLDWGAIAFSRGNT